MKILRTFRLSIRFASLLVAQAALLPAVASDHADPMNLLNPFEVQKDPEANITDLHAFIVDNMGKRISRLPDAAAGDRLILSLCVRRSITEQGKDGKIGPGDSTGLRPEDYTYRVHLDFGPRVRVVDLESSDKEVERLTAAVRDVPENAAEEKDEATRTLAEYLARTNADRAAQFRYGGIIEKPGDIAEDAGLEFRIQYVPGNGTPGSDGVKLVHQALTGKWVGDRTITVVGPDSDLPEGKIYSCTGIFDDPFIFPRFFRRNVIGIVTSIPLDRLPPVSPVAPPGQPRPVILWATTHDKKNRQIDHVGRSLRTQLPRFGYLNGVPPAGHRTLVQRVHKSPTIVEDAFSTFVGPLFAHRHYDEVPDVMIYNLSKPARFPNGRALEDDVAAILAEGGETLLYELSFAESEQFPRATRNDKPFRERFPYLASRWKAGEILSATPGKTHLLSGPVPDRLPDSRSYPVPYAPLAEVTAPPALKPSTLVKLGLVAVLALLAALAAAALLIWLGYHLGRHRGLAQAGKPDDEGQGLLDGEESDEGSCFAEVRKAVIDKESNRPYVGELPRDGVSFWKVAAGMLPWGKPALLKLAVRRTLHSRRDLRWGRQGKGSLRLIHPNGVCLAGKWLIDPDATTNHTGWFAKGSEGLVIARLSPARAETRRGYWRSNGLVGKIYPTIDPDDRSVRRSAAFITQENLGGTRVDQINDMEFLNAPDLHAWRRGKGIFSLLLTGIVFAKLNVNAVIRQLHEIAELHHPLDPPVTRPRCPNFMRLKVQGGYRVPGEALDVRDEVLNHVYRETGAGGTPGLVLSIEVSDHPVEPPSPGVLSPRIVRNIPENSWVKIGKIVFDEAACSHNGDEVIHFHHPLWRTDVNNPGSVSDVK